MDNYLYIADICLLDNEETFKKAYQLVSKERRDKVDKLISIKDKKLSLLAELLLMKALNDLDINQTIEYNEYKKPYLKNNDIMFNISHSNKYAICAISSDEIGCDIEYIRDINLDIARKYFNNSEYKAIMESSNQLDTFYRFWTLKESFMKNCGLGFNINIKDFEISLKDKISVNHNINDNCYRFKEIDIPGYKCSVCLLNNKEIKVKHINNI